MARLGSRAAWHCRAPNSAPVTPTTTTVSASAPRCSQEVSGAGGHPHAAPVSASLRCHPPTLLPSHRMVVRCLWPLQPEWHLLPGPEQHPQAQRHPLAPLPGAQLLPEGHPHDDPTHQLLTCLRPVPALREKSGTRDGWGRLRCPSCCRELLPRVIFFTPCLSHFPEACSVTTAMLEEPWAEVKGAAGAGAAGAGGEQSQTCQSGLQHMETP